MNRSRVFFGLALLIVLSPTFAEQEYIKAITEDGEPVRLYPNGRWAPGEPGDAGGVTDGVVVDEAELLGEDDEAALVRRIEAIKRSHALRIRIVLLDKGETPIVATLLRRWSQRTECTERCVLLLVLKSDRRMHIQASTDMENAYAERERLRIRKDVIGPHFKRGDFVAGLSAACEAFRKLASGG